MRNIAFGDFFNDKIGSLYRKDRSGMRGGGIVLAISNKYVHGEITLNIPEAELVAAEIFTPKRIVVAGMYVPPHQSKDDTVKHLTSFLSCIRSDDDDGGVIIMGDFNEDLSNQGTHRIHDFLASKGFSQHVKSPTTDYGTIIDHIYSINISSVESEIQDCYYSDHDKMYCFINL